MNKDKTILRALAGERQETPPIWMMRQAGRYLPEYRATRAEAGDFLSLCYNSELAAEVTLQPIRRYGFDAAILFADILLLPQALGVDLWFETGEGPRMSTTTTANELAGLRATADIHETLNPIYETVRILSRELPRETTLIGFAGAPWTVATYMIAGRGTKDQGPAHALKAENHAVFEGILERLTEATIEYLSKQIEAGAEVVKLFDSWAGSLKGEDFVNYALKPAAKITQTLKQRHPGIPVIAFPREAGDGYIGFAKATGADCIAIDNSVSAEWRTHGFRSTTRSIIEICPASGDSREDEVREWTTDQVATHVALLHDVFWEHKAPEYSHVFKRLPELTPLKVLKQQHLLSHVLAFLHASSPKTVSEGVSLTVLERRFYFIYLIIHSIL